MFLRPLKFTVQPRLDVLIIDIYAKFKERPHNNTTSLRCCSTQNTEWFIIYINFIEHTEHHLLHYAPP